MSTVYPCPCCGADNRIAPDNQPCCYGEKPRSALTLQRPDLWRTALELSAARTGLRFVPKVPLPDGTIYCCGGGPSKKIDRDLVELETDIERLKAAHRVGRLTETGEESLVILQKELKRIKERKNSLAVAVPEGAVEWLLHEVGHWLASTTKQRALPNYGLARESDADVMEHELRALAFQEIIFSPVAQARHLTPTSQKDGWGFDGPERLNSSHFRFAERAMIEANFDRQEWQSVFLPFANWEMSRFHTNSRYRNHKGA